MVVIEHRGQRQRIDAQVVAQMAATFTVNRRWPAPTQRALRTRDTRTPADDVPRWQAGAVVLSRTWSPTRSSQPPAGTSGVLVIPHAHGREAMAAGIGGGSIGGGGGLGSIGGFASIGDIGSASDMSMDVGAASDAGAACANAAIDTSFDSTPVDRSMDQADSGDSSVGVDVSAQVAATYASWSGGSG